MNKEYQLGQLRRIIEDPDTSSGLYLIDTVLDDNEIEKYIKDLDGCAYLKISLLPSKDSSVFEMFVIGLSYKFDNQSLVEMVKLLLSDATQKRDNVLLTILLDIMRNHIERRTILHLEGEKDLSSFIYEDLCKLKTSLDYSSHPIIIINKPKHAIGIKKDPNINIITFQENNFMEKRTEKVHISYKHDTAYKADILAIKTGLQENNIPYSIDEYDILYRDNIDDYEKEIGSSDIVIMFVIPNYLTSLECMFEMTQIFKNGNIKTRLFPVVDMGEIKRNGDGLIKIKDYWSKEKIKKSEQIKTEPGGSSFLIKEIQKIDDILKTMDDLWTFLCRENSGSYHKLIDNNAKQLMEEIKKYLCPKLAPDTENFTPTTATKPTGTRVITQNGEKSLYIENNNGNITIS
ncbi:toll/interleukin-1 receptor domain-containing protein [Prevotella pallens]|uniref:TIR domain-containing protein n=2 Tax=Prevotella pallens TaxID=60133 RepID=A0ABX9DN85_9BACT|nr:toll/interleukin-1 receptor domain-containing protein [Prevotella pallens]RAS42501.1 TIR domain-containing protein [Prevotella pallens]